MEELPPPPPALIRTFVTQESGNWNGEVVAEGLSGGLAWSVRVQGPQWLGQVAAGYRLPFNLALLAAGEATPNGVGGGAGLQYFFEIFPRTTRVRLEALAGTFLQGSLQTDYEFWPRWEVSALYRYRHVGLHTFGAGLGYRL